MIDPSSIDLPALPWVPLSSREDFPAISGIYFAIDSQGSVQYIGRSNNIRERWKSHHRYEQLDAIGKVKIAYLIVETVELLPSIEAALISWFEPPLNRVGIRHSYPRIARLSMLKELRLKVSLTAAQVSFELGVSPSTVANWDQGRTYPTLNPVLMLKLCEMYKCSLEDLAEACEEKRFDRSN